MQVIENKSIHKFDEQGIKKALKIFQGFCGDEWIRTTDSRIFSPMLYQLSYITVLK